IIGVVLAFVPDNLVYGHAVVVVRLGTGADHRLVLNVSPRFLIARLCQPNTGIVAFVKKIPLSFLDPDGRRAIRAFVKWFAVGFPDVEWSVIFPGDAIAGCQHMRSEEHTSELQSREN